MLRPPSLAHTTFSLFFMYDYKAKKSDFACFTFHRVLHTQKLWGHSPILKQNLPKVVSMTVDLVMAYNSPTTLAKDLLKNLNTGLECCKPILC